MAVRNVLHEDRNRNGVADVLEQPVLRAVPPAPAHPGANVGILAGAVGAVFVLMGVVVFFLVGTPTSRRSSTPVTVAPPPATATATATPTATVVSAAATVAKVEQLPSSTASAKSAPAKPVAKLTNEQFGKNVVAAQHKKLLACMEQDLVRNPGAPKAYTVTVHVERDGQPLNSDTRFVPTASSGFHRCAKFAIFYGFDRNSPEPGEYWFTTSFAFPNAKPAATADSRWE